LVVGVLRRDRLDVDDALALAEADDDHALRVAAGLADLAHARADDLAAVGDDDDLIVRLDERELHELAVTRRAIHGDDALAGAALEAPLGDGRALAVAVLADREHLLTLGVGDDGHAHDAVALAELDALHAHRVAAHRAHLGDLEADAHAARRAEDDLVGVAHDRRGEELVALLDGHGDDAGLA